ncbi:hypothetical protein C2845_PM01G26820 [Panicum miliaceum]|uniref:Uncharacterized protein n=1 Tax=Panicum miliaceum TaxID=4540 RepID=A0A3L6TVP2_PANMI|nr:hypothetical protein C2845_PM01G26820 [Panicum miliaceum]
MNPATLGIDSPRPRLFEHPAAVPAVHSMGDRDEAAKILAARRGGHWPARTQRRNSEAALGKDRMGFAGLFGWDFPLACGGGGGIDDDDGLCRNQELGQPKPPNAPPGTITAEHHLSFPPRHRRCRARELSCQLDRDAPSRIQNRMGIPSRHPGHEEEEEYDDAVFYEDIQAPKFVDLTAPDAGRPDDDPAWFCLRVGK